jgi:hypothetical protein
MANFVLAQIDEAITLFNSLIKHGAGNPRYQRNLQWLVKLRARASSKISKASALGTAGSHQVANRRKSREDREDRDDVELLGWRTRLIERASQNHKDRRNNHTTATTLDSHAKDASQHANELGMLATSATLPTVTPESTNGLLHDFWDPLLLQDIFELPPDQANVSMPGKFFPQRLTRYQAFLNNDYAWWDDAAIATDVSTARM